MIRIAAIVLLLSCAAATAQFFRLPIGPGSQQPLGPSGAGGGSGPTPPGPCTPTGLDFTNQCNSVYIVAIGF